jgi:3-phenylpropionate/trans-cinnamate dioxygenase alpha subunit
MSAPDVATTLEEMSTGIAEGRVPARIFNDQAIFDLERSRLFSKAWCFLAHDTEIPAAGDYVVRDIAGNSIIVARDEHGHVHAHLNMCRHRGNQMCKSELGNASHFRCSFHVWVS